MIDREFRVGDRVTCNIFGLGEVIEIDNDYITVIFSNKIIGTYSKDGKYNINLKRTLFILPKIKPTLKQVIEKYKQLLDEVDEVEFIQGSLNWFLDFYCDRIDYNYKIDIGSNIRYYQLNIKYITLENARKIEEEINNFIKGEEK